MKESGVSWLAQYQMPRYRVPGKSTTVYAELDCNRQQKGPLRTAQVRREAAGISKGNKRKGTPFPILATVDDVKRYQAKQGKRDVQKSSLSGAGRMSLEKLITGLPKRTVAGSPSKSALSTPLQNAMSEIDSEANEAEIEIAKKQGELIGIQRAKATFTRHLSDLGPRQ